MLAGKSVDMFLSCATICTAAHYKVVDLLYGLLHESYAHERLKSSLAFRWPGMAVVSGRMARADGVYISLERPGLPGAGRSPGSAGGGSWLAHRSRIMLGVRDG